MTLTIILSERWCHYLARNSAFYGPGDSRIGTWAIDLAVEVSQPHMVSELGSLFLAKRGDITCRSSLSAQIGGPVIFK